MFGMQNKEEFQVCAFSTYPSLYKKGRCLQSPFLSLKINQFLHANRTLTISAEYSDMWSYQDFDTRNKLQYKWTLLTPATLQTTQVKAQSIMERVDIDTQS